MLNDLLKPKRLECDRSLLTKTYGKFVAEPLERGFGVTLGNSLRRVLLSFLPGAAVTAAKIDGVYHEFSTIVGVREDVSEILLNLKELVIKMKTDEPRTIFLRAQGEGEVKGKDITGNDEVEVLNPNLHIATLNREGRLDMELVVKPGRSYVPAERNKDDSLDPQMIPLDAVFSPVKKANFVVENTRVGQSTDFERLILEVETDGSLHPEEAVTWAARIMKDQLNIFTQFQEEMGLDIPKVDEKKISILANLDKNIDELELSVRAYNCLISSNIRTIRDLVQKSDNEILKTRNFGRKSLNEIKDILAEMGLSLGMNLKQMELSEGERHSGETAEGTTSSEELDQEAMMVEDFDDITDFEEEEEEEEEELEDTKAVPPPKD